MVWKQARKPRSYASSKLRPSHLLTRVKCRATSVAKNVTEELGILLNGCSNNLMFVSIGYNISQFNLYFHCCFRIIVTDVYIKKSNHSIILDITGRGTFAELCTRKVRTFTGSIALWAKQWKWGVPKFLKVMA